MVHEDYKELLAARALTALDPADAGALDSHLQGCAACRAEMREWEQTAAFLAIDTDRREPTPELRQRILGAAAREDRRGQFADAPVKPEGERSTSHPSSRVLPFERPRRDVWTSLRSFGAVAATLVIGALIISLLLLWQQNRLTQRELARLASELQRANAHLVHERAVVELLTSPDAHMAKLAGTKDAPGAQAMLAYNTNGHAMLLARGLPAVPKGMAYQLWYIKDNKKMPGKVFTPDAAGNGILEDQIPALAREARVFAITLEPESGVQVPTGSIYLLSAS